MTLRCNLSTRAALALVPALLLALALSTPVFAAAPAATLPHAAPGIAAVATSQAGALPAWSSAILSPAQAAWPAQHLDVLLGPPGLATCRACDRGCTDGGCFCRPLGQLLCCACL